MDAGPQDPASALSAPVIDSSLSSPSFSIGSEDEDDDEDDDGRVAHASGDRDDSIGASGADNARPPLVVAVAEKEVLEDVNDEAASPMSPREAKAKSMVDEEGEIFRRAKSLQLREEAGEDLLADEAEDEQPASEEDRALPQDQMGHDAPVAGVGAASSPTSADLKEHSPAPSTESPPIVPPRPSFSSAESAASAPRLQSRGRRSSSSSITSPDGSSKELPTSMQASQDEDLPGEELRKRLLEADFDSAPPTAGNGAGSEGVTEGD